jgi:4-amino-4-deoxy-L-arabinose transferase-like glycosyltransferase
MNQGMSPRNRADLLLLAAFCGFLFFYGLGALGLVGADEPRYAQVAREMLDRSDWVTPTLLGKPWLEKPVLYYWEAMLSFRAFGVTDRAARLPAAFDAALLIAAIYLFLWRFRSGSELDGALIAASCAGVIGFARAAATDMPLAACFAIALLGWYGWYESRQRIYLSAFYIFLGLGTLAKGPVAPALAAVIIFLFVAVKRDWLAIPRTLWIPGIALFLAVMLPWYIAVQLRNPGFFRFFILEHNLARFSQDVYHHRQPFWFYQPVFLLAMMPWTLLLTLGVVESLRLMWADGAAPKGAADFADLSASLKRCPDTRRGAPGADAFDGERKNAGADATDGERENAGADATYTERKNKDNRAFSSATDSWALFLLIWMLVPILFFSASQSKLPGYILPAVPAGALLVAEYLDARRGKGKKISSLFAAAHGVLCGVLVFTALSAASIAMNHHLLWGTGTWVAAATGAVVALGISAALLSRAGLRLVSRATMFAVVVSLAAVIRFAAPVIDATQSARPIAESIQAFSHQAVPIGIYHVNRTQEYGLEFYLNRATQKYEDGNIPSAAHVLVAAQGTQVEVAQLVPGRRVSYLTSIPAQRLDLYWVGK